MVWRLRVLLYVFKYNLAAVMNYVCMDLELIFLFPLYN
jgi:hypothetical protein